MNGGAVAFWWDQSEASLALIMVLTALDQQEPNMSQPAGCVHVFAWKPGIILLMQMQNIALHGTNLMTFAEYVRS